MTRSLFRHKRRPRRLPLRQQVLMRWLDRHRSFWQRRRNYMWAGLGL